MYSLSNKYTNQNKCVGENLENKKNANSIMIKKSTFTSLVVVLVIAIAISAFFAGNYVSNFNSDKVTQSDLKNAFAKLEEKIGTNTQPSIQPNTQPIRVSVDDDPMKGNPNAPITIIEFSDYECPFCGKFYTDTLPLIEENYINTGKVNFVYRDFPIQSIHPNAVSAAMAAECADDQEMFWPYHDMIFENKSTWEKQRGQNLVNELAQYAVVLGLDVEEFTACLESNKHLDEIKNDLQDGQSYGISGTPGFFIGNDNSGYIKVSGAKPYQAFEEILEEMLAQ
ncbi:Na antiporter NhaA 2 protein [Marine Group I thaumarchaeote SCGC AAA799-E16]|uniref:Na antiporter NhaA 2 protein n=1 Tax=Marine Group I thaumarchaeote SCGC AAA799-E16 TaxID=1502292 RepID=A0A081S5C6_9ARCH|nr:Na antiporter NhaA 2 protein [Marine Group I thaumarchaeote SCGC AAA799-E16]